MTAAFRDLFIIALCTALLIHLAFFTNAPAVEAGTIAKFVKAYNAEMLKP